MRWITNTTTMRERNRGVSPEPHLSVDAGSNLGNKKSSAPSARVSNLHIIQEYTTASAAVVGRRGGGSRAWLEKIHREAPLHVASRPD